MKIIKNHQLQESVLLLALCGYLVWYSLDGYAAAFNKDWTQSPFLFPLVMAGLLGILGLLLLKQAISSILVDNKEKRTGMTGFEFRNVLAVMGLCILYYLALSLVRMPYLTCRIAALTLQLSTFEVATIVFVGVLMYVLGVRKKLWLIAVPLGTSAFLSVTFRSLLHVILP